MTASARGADRGVRLAPGAFVLDPPLAQAALSGYSDLPMRLVARRHGAPYALQEVVIDEHLLKRGRLQRRFLEVHPEDHPLGGQLLGSSPERMAEAAKLLVLAGHDAIDLNFACPVARMLGRGRGGHLLGEPEKALAIVDSVVQAVGDRVPVTLKLRRGTDDSPEAERRFFRILLGAFEFGIAAATVHGRTVAQKYEGPSDWSFLARVRREIGDRTLIGSGDLFEAEDVPRMLRETGVDGVSVARGCVGNPFLFSMARALLRGERPEPPSPADLGEALLTHWRLAVRHYGGEAKAISSLRMHAIRYAARLPDPIRARDAMVAIRGPSEFVPAVVSTFGCREDAPGVLGGD
ncbi:MAG: tRNA-dihydrouridine synthase [Planctomycetota bacterium]